ncbi:MAG: alpha/beta hydrolase [Myxococcales bacterium]|nr:alpha/beta hydrolase [Myxococcales bacterium]
MRWPLLRACIALVLVLGACKKEGPAGTQRSPETIARLTKGYKALEAKTTAADVALGAEMFSKARALRPDAAAGRCPLSRAQILAGHSIVALATLQMQLVDGPRALRHGPASMALSHTRSLSLFETHLKQRYYSQQDPLARALDDYKIVPDTRNWLLLLVDHKVRPKMVSNKQFRPGGIDGTLYVWDGKKRQIVCAAPASARSSGSVRVTRQVIAGHVMPKAKVIDEIDLAIDLEKNAVKTALARLTGVSPRGKLVAVRDTRLYVRDRGDAGKPLLLVVHGGPGGNHKALLPLESLSSDYRVVLYDQRGSGASERLAVKPKDKRALAKLSVREHVEDIEALRRALGRERIALIGHSWGAALAVFYAAAYPDRVSKLVVYSGGPETPALAKKKREAHRARMNEVERMQLQVRTKRLLAAIKAQAPQAELDKRFVELASVTFPSLNCKRPAADGPEDLGRGGFWANQAAGAYIKTFSYRRFAKRLQKVKAPVLLSWGRCEPSPQARLTNLLDSFPDARFVIFEKSGHNALDEQRELFLATVRAFLAGDKLPLRAYRKRADVPAAPASASGAAPAPKR